MAIFNSYVSLPEVHSKEYHGFYMMEYNGSQSQKITRLYLWDLYSGIIWECLWDYLWDICSYVSNGFPCYECNGYNGDMMDISLDTRW